MDSPEDSPKKLEKAKLKYFLTRTLVSQYSVEFKTSPTDAKML